MARDQTKPRYSPEATLLKRQRNFGKWVIAATQLHGHDRFRYETAAKAFRTQRGPSVEIVCRVHELSYHVLPADHLRYKGGGCPECEYAARSVGKLNDQRTKFMTWFNETCAARLSLESAFLGMTKRIQIRCTRHDQVEHTKPTSLMVEGKLGCRLCAKEIQSNGLRLQEEELRRELAPGFPSHIQFLGTVFDEVLRATKIRIECARHGERQVNAAYLRKSRYKCPACGDENVGQGANRLRQLLETGDEGRPTWLVIAEVEVFGITSLEVGTTSRTIQERYSWHLKKTFFSARLREIDAHLLEARVHRAFVAARDQRIFLAGMCHGERWSGDTECYWPDRRLEIEEFVKHAVEHLSVEKPDYWAELNALETPQWGVVDTSREKDLSNQPRAIVCIDTGICFSSIADAARAVNTSHGNIGSVLAGRRRLAGGVRWAYAEEADARAQEPLRPKRLATVRVRCVDTDEVFASVSDAGRAKQTSSSHITSVCKGRRVKAGGFCWEYVDEASAHATCNCTRLATPARRGTPPRRR